VRYAVNVAVISGDLASGSDIGKKKPAYGKSCTLVQRSLVRHNRHPDTRTVSGRPGVVWLNVLLLLLVGIVTAWWVDSLTDWGRSMT
jgi:hypothetical protein